MGHICGNIVWISVGRLCGLKVMNVACLFLIRTNYLLFSSHFSGLFLKQMTYCELCSGEAILSNTSNSSSVDTFDFLFYSNMHPFSYLLIGWHYRVKGQYHHIFYFTKFRTHESLLYSSKIITQTMNSNILCLAFHNQFLKAQFMLW